MEISNELICCTKCANIFPSPTIRDIVCPECHSPIDLEDYKKNIGYAHNAGLFGYTYRSIYERDFEELGECSSRYYLLPSEVLDFITLAALSGIIGNLAYDLIKAVIKKIIDNRRKSGISDYEELINDPQEFDKFMRYISDFAHAEVHPNSEVEAAINSEILVDIRIGEIDKKTLDPPNEEDFDEYWQLFE